MNNLDDILDLSCLSPDEIAILRDRACDARVNRTLQAEWAMQHGKGAHHLDQMICEDIREALHMGDQAHAGELYATLRSFVTQQREPA